MVDYTLSDELRAELARLALLPDESIDTSDITEVSDWSDARRSAFFDGEIRSPGYDVRALANWFIEHLSKIGVTVSNLSLNKIVYFAVERSLIEKSILLTPARIEAWNHGPVFREIYHAFKGNSDQPISSLISYYSTKERAMTVARSNFSPDDLAFLIHIADIYGRISASRLRNMTHEDSGPWASVWNYKGRINPGMEISAHTILRFAPVERI